MRSAEFMTVKQLKELLANKPDSAAVFIQVHSASCAMTMNFPAVDVLATGDLVFVTCGKHYERAGGTA